MNISKNTVTEIEQIYTDIISGPETPLREQLSIISGERETETFSRFNDGVISDAMVGAIAESERMGFVMGFIYARTLFG